MAGQLDSLFRSVAKSVVATLGESFDHTISYTQKGVSSYNIDTGEQVTVDTTYSDLKVPISFVRSEEETAQEMREAKIYITPDLIGNNQPDLEDEITKTCKSFAINNFKQEKNLIDTIKQNCRKIIKEKTGKRPFTNVNIARI